MIVGAPELEAEAGRSRLASRVEWSGGHVVLWIEADSELIADPADTAPFLPVCLLAAMVRHEDLEVRGQASERLLGSLPLAQAVLHSWDLSLRRAAIGATGAPSPSRPGDRVSITLMSRGVDSLYAAAKPKPDPVDALLHIEGLEPIHSAATGAEERRLAAEVGAALGKPMLEARTNLRALTDPILDWSDAHGVGLATAVLGLGGGVSRALIPSWASYEGLCAAGSHPLLDPLFSTEAVTVAHDSIEHGRLGKVQWLARERPDLLPFLKVCYRVDEPGNCGRCAKCLHTMACLYAVSALEEAPGFPSELDFEAVAGSRAHSRYLRVSYNQIHRALPAGDPLARAIERMLRRSARPTPRDRLRRWAQRGPLGPPYDETTARFFRHDTNETVALLVDGRPYPQENRRC